jgi:hypothetical protein
MNTFLSDVPPEKRLSVILITVGIFVVIGGMMVLSALTRVWFLKAMGRHPEYTKYFAIAIIVIILLIWLAGVFM